MFKDFMAGLVAYTCNPSIRVAEWVWGVIMTPMCYLLSMRTVITPVGRDWEFLEYRYVNLDVSSVMFQLEKN
jgi:hypothetical protein